MADIRFPREPGDDIDINTIIGDIVDNLGEALGTPLKSPSERIPGRPELAGGKALEAPKTSFRHILGFEGGPTADARRMISIDLDVRFKEVKAMVPVVINLDLDIIVCANSVTN